MQEHRGEEAPPLPIKGVGAVVRAPVHERCSVGLEQTGAGSNRRSKDEAVDDHERRCDHRAGANSLQRRLECAPLYQQLLELPASLFGEPFSEPLRGLVIRRPELSGFSPPP